MGCSDPSAGPVNRGTFRRINAHPGPVLVSARHMTLRQLLSQHPTCTASSAPLQQLLTRSCSHWTARPVASYRIVRAPRWGCTHAHDRTWQALPLQVIAHSDQHACLATLVAVLHGTCSSSSRDESSPSRRCPLRQGRWVRAEAQEWRGRGTCSAPALRRCSPRSERVTNVLPILLSPACSHILLARLASAGGHHCMSSCRHASS